MDPNRNRENAHKHHEAVRVALAQTAEVPSDQKTSEQQEKSIDCVGDHRRIGKNERVHLIY
jgi:hypothetical protein